MTKRKTTKRIHAKAAHAKTVEQIVDSINLNMAQGNPWFGLGDPLTPGLHVQKSTPRGESIYDVVRIVSLNRGYGAQFNVFDLSGREVSPLIQCHSVYQAIKE